MFEALRSQRYSRPALHDMDRLFEPYLPHDAGVFLEAGAHDGFTQSNTYYLERFRSWRGILVEPAPTLYPKAVSRRRRSHVIQCALVGPDHIGTVTLKFGDLTSTTFDDSDHAARGLATSGLHGYAVEVPARTLSDVIDEAGEPHIDLMVLDLEGRELEALAGLDRDRHHVQLIMIEMLDMAVQRPAFDAALASTHAFVAALSPWDALYRARDA
jgi:FkbM family methyltransferase